MGGPWSAFRASTQSMNVDCTHQDRSKAVILRPASNVVYYALMATGPSAQRIAVAAEIEDEIEH